MKPTSYLTLTAKNFSYQFSWIVFGASSTMTGL
jgi:hypothetical protein